MWCDQCGTKLPDGAAVCTNCGKPVPGKMPSVGFGFSSAGSLLEDVPPTMPEMASVKREPPVKPVSPVTPPPPVRPAAPPSAAAPVRPAAPAAPVRPAAPEKKHIFGGAPTAAPKTAGESMRIPFDRELKLLLRQGWLVLLGEQRNLIFSLLFPVMAAFVTVWVAGEHMFDNMESTKSACFVLVCAAIWCGLFNSIQTVVKERENIKRDYVSGALRIECYVLSRAILQMGLCMVQSLVLVLAIPGVEWQYGNHLPSSGLIFGEPMVEYFISLFLLMYASDILGMLISSFVKKPELASQLAPYILIVQLLFSGVLFQMEGGAEVVSALMLSRWGMEALGSISDLNDLPLRIVQENEALEQLIDRDKDYAFLANSDHLMEVWLIMLVFIAVQLVLANFCLRGVKKDTRM